MYKYRPIGYHHMLLLGPLTSVGTRKGEKREIYIYLYVLDSVCLVVFKSFFGHFSTD